MGRIELSHVYIDPAGSHYRSPNLISELTRFRSTKAAVPEENQMTAALAWLLDRSQVFAREFASLFIDGDVLDGVTRFGTQTQVALPNPTGKGLLWPDLALAGDARSFELLVEVKVGAEPNEYPEGEQVFLQPDMYAKAWRLRPDEAQASVRRVGTLTRGFDFPSTGDEWRAPDITWREVRDRLRPLIDSDQLEPSVALVARDFSDVIGVVVLREPLVPPAHIDALQAAGRNVLLRIREPLGTALGATPGRPAKHADGMGLLLRRQDYELWIIVTPAGGMYNLFGNGDAVGIRLMSPGEKLYPGESQVHAGGFRRNRDLTGYRDDRLYVELDTAEGEIDDPASVGDQIIELTLAALRACRPPLI